MTKILARLTEQVRQKLPTRTVLLVPGECFFCRSLELPKGIKPQEIGQLAEFSLEGLSPFSFEQLAWGFLYDPSWPRILLYASYDGRLRKKGCGELETYYRVFPSFISAVGRTYEQPTVSFLCHDTSLSALFYPAQSRLPEKIVSVPLPQAELNDAAILEGCKALLESLDHTHYAVEEGVWVVTVAGTDPDDTISFIHRHVNNRDPQPQPEAAPLPLDETSLWYADIRPDAYLQKMRKEYNLSRKIWKGTTAAGLAAALLILLQFGSFAMDMWVKSREETIRVQSEEVLRIEENFELLQKIEQFAQQELKPFEMLEATNAGRPSTVYFTKAYTENFNQLRIEGLGSNVEVVNRYTEQLRQSPRIAKVETRVSARRGKAPFSLAITFKGPDYDPGEVIAEAQLPQTP